MEAHTVCSKAIRSGTSKGQLIRKRRSGQSDNGVPDSVPAEQNRQPSAPKKNYSVGGKFSLIVCAMSSMDVRWLSSVISVLFATFSSPIASLSVDRCQGQR